MREPSGAKAAPVRSNLSPSVRASPATGARQPASSSTEQVALGVDLAMRGGIVEPRDEIRDGCVPAADDDRERALADRGEHHRRRQDLGDLFQALEPRQPRPREDDRVPAALLKPPDARVDVAARFDDLDVGTGRQDLSAPPRARGPTRAPAQRLEWPAVARDEDVAFWVFARRTAAMTSLPEERRQVFQL